MLVQRTPLRSRSIIKSLSLGELRGVVARGSGLQLVVPDMSYLSCASWWSRSPHVSRSHWVAQPEKATRGPAGSELSSTAGVAEGGQFVLSH